MAAMHDPEDPTTRAAIEACLDIVRRRGADADPPIGATADAADLDAA